MQTCNYVSTCMYTNKCNIVHKCKHVKYVHTTYKLNEYIFTKSHTEWLLTIYSYMQQQTTICCSSSVASYVVQANNNYSQVDMANW